MHNILFKIGPFTLYSYGFFVFLGVLSGYLFVLKEAKKQKIKAEIISDIVFYALLGGFFGARFVYIIVEWPQFLKHPLSVIFSRSGFVFYGGLIFGFLAFAFAARKHRLNFLKTADIFSPALALGHSLGRIGCFMHGCCFGRPTNSFIGMYFPPSSPAGQFYPGVKVIPTQIISSFFLLVIFSLLLWVRDRKKFEGEVFFAYLIFYGIFRFIIEFFRGDPRGQLGFFSTSQVIALIVVGAAVLFWFKEEFKSVKNK